MFNRVIFICGVPRSGTSWIGQILDSSPQTAYRFQPLFSWAFKDNIGLDSDKKQCEAFLQNVYYTSDAFVLQTERKQQGVYPIFKRKDDCPPVLVIKMVRYHHLLPLLLTYFQDILQVVCIVRHPCGVINSWLKNPKEFFSGCDPLVEWDLAESRNKGKPEEFWGFDGWRRALDIYSTIKLSFPQNVYIVNYEKFVEHPVAQVKTLFDFLKLETSAQTIKFLSESTQTDHDDPYAVFKTKHVRDDWKTELAPEIQKAIVDKLQLTPYHYLLDSNENRDSDNRL